MFVGTAAMAIATAYAAKSGLPWWGLIVALIFAAALVPVVGTVSGHTVYILHHKTNVASSSTVP